MKKSRNNKNYIKKDFYSRDKNATISNNLIDKEILKLDDQMMITFREQILIDDEGISLCYP